MKKIQSFFHGLYQNEEGATAVEYGVLIALIIAVCVVIIGVLGGQVSDAFDSVVQALSNS